MFTKIRNAMLALAAVATLGVGTLVATTDSADARGFGGGGGGFQRGGGFSGGMRHIGGGPRFHGGRIGGGVRVVGSGWTHKVGQPRPHFRPHWCHRWYSHCRVHVRWPRPVYVGAPVIAATSYAVAPAVARPCTCLTKEYTPDNLVVFKDVCTKEVASAPIGNTQVQLPVPADPAQPQVR
jgi:hypothetical protein